MRNDEQEPWGAFLANPSEAQFTLVYEQARALVWTLCCRIAGNPEDARDAYQATWCRLFAEVRSGEAAAETRAGGLAFRDYLCRLAVREAQNLKKRHLRRARREIAVDPLPEPPQAAPAADQLAAREESRQRLETLIRLLPEELRLALQLHFFHGLSQDEVARMLDVSPSTVSRRIARGVRRLEAMIRKAGLAEALGGVAVLGVAGALLEPPEALSAGVIYGQAQAALAVGGAGVAAAGKGLAAGKISSGVMLMKVKMAVVAGAVLLSLGGLIIGRQVMGGWHGAPGKAAAAQVASAGAGKVPGARGPGSPEDAARKAREKQAGSPAARGGGEGNSMAADDTQSSLTNQAPVAGTMIAGRVTDAETKRPIAGAEIKLDGKAGGRTDASGIYRIAGAKAGQVELEATAEGHARRYAVVNVPPAGLAGQNFDLDPATDITVRVRDEKGAPVADVTVDAEGLREGFMVERVGKTNAAGEAVIPRMSRLKPPRISVKKTGYLQKSMDGIRQFDAKTRTEITYTVEAIKDMDRVIQGRVVDTAGKSAAGVTVQWSPFLGVQKGGDKVQSDADGRYRLAFKNESKECRLSVYGEGWAPVVVPHFLAGTPAEPAQRDFTLEGGHWLAGEVVDEDGKPVKGARLEVMPTRELLFEWSYPGVTRRAVTEADGKFRLKDLTGPMVALSLRGPRGEKDWTGREDAAVAVDRSIKLTLKAAGVIAGRVVDKETGKPVTNFNIKLTGGASLPVSRIRPGETFTVADGRFVLKELDQDCKMDFTIEAAGYIIKSVKTVPVESVKQPPTEHEIRLSRGREVRGVLVDAATKALIKGAKVEFGVWDGGRMYWGTVTRNQEIGNAQEAVSGADGMFTFREEEPGTLFIAAEGHRRLIIRPQERSQYSSGGGESLWIPLVKGEAIQGTNYNNGKPAKGNYLGLIRMDADPAGTLTRGYQGLGSLIVDESGHFSKDGLAPGIYGLLTSAQSPQDYQTGGTTVFRRFELKEGEQKTVSFGDDMGPLVFRGRLLDRQGRPQGYARLALRPAFPWSYDQFIAYIVAQYDGRFYFPGLKPGKYLVELQNWNDETLPPVEITGNAERDIVADPYPQAAH